MKTLVCLCVAFFATTTTFAAKIPCAAPGKKAAASETINATENAKAPVDETANASFVEALKPLTVTDLQKTLGRKLTIKEKISWWLYQKKLIHIDPSEKEIKNANSNAVLGFAFGILSIIGLSFLAAIPGLILSNKALIAEKADPGILKGGNYGLAQAGQILSWIGLAIFLFTLILVLALLSHLH